MRTLVNRKGQIVHNSEKQMMAIDVAFRYLKIAGAMKLRNSERISQAESARKNLLE